MIIQKTLYVLISAVILMTCFTPAIAKEPATHTETQTREVSEAKVVQLLSDSGYLHRKTGKNTWVIEGQGRSKILVASGVEFVVVGLIVAVKRNLRVTMDLNLKLLKLNHSLNYLKVGFDDDDDLFVRTEFRLRTIDVVTFKAMVQDVVQGAETTRQAATPYLITP